MVNNDNDQARSVFSDTCGTVNLSASRSLVAVVVYQKKGWVLWQFKGEVTDSLGDDHSIYLYSTTGGSLSDSYELSTRGYRTLKLTGEARDLVSGHGCIVEDDAQITHTY